MGEAFEIQRAIAKTAILIIKVPIERAGIEEVRVVMARTRIEVLAKRLEEP